jgi:hypothetical protein
LSADDLPVLGSDTTAKETFCFVQTVDPSALDGAEVHENVLAAIIRLDEAEAFSPAKPFDGGLCHASLVSGVHKLFEILEGGRQSNTRLR